MNKARRGRAGAAKSPGPTSTPWFDKTLSPLGGLQRRNDSELLHHAHAVDVIPLLHDLALSKAGGDGPCYFYPVVGRREAPKLALVGAAARVAGRHPVPFGYLILDDNPEVGKRGAQHRDPLLLESFETAQRPSRNPWIVQNVVGREKLIHHALIALVEDLTSMRNCKTLEVRFRALLSQDEIRQLEVVRA